MSDCERCGAPLSEDGRYATAEYGNLAMRLGFVGERERRYRAALENILKIATSQTGSAEAVAGQARRVLYEDSVA